MLNRIARGLIILAAGHYGKKYAVKFAKKVF